MGPGKPKPVDAPTPETCVRDLIRRDQERNDKIAAMQRFVDEGLETGVGTRSRDALFAAALER